MTTSAVILTQRVRRFVRDWPEQDSLTASCTSGAATVTVADATLYSANWMVQIDSEVCRVVSGVGTTLTVRRGQMGTTGASHASAAVLLVRPKFIDIEILDAINGGISAAFPMIYQRIVDETLTTSQDVYEYAIPDSAVTGYKIPFLSEVWVKDAGDIPYHRSRSFRIRRGTTPKIQFMRAPAAGGTIRLVGYGPFTPLTAATSLHADFPPNAEDLIVWYAANYLLASGEAGRVRVETGAIDSREQAQRVGSSMQAANTLFQRFQMRLRDAGMAPMPPHVVSVI